MDITFLGVGEAFDESLPNTSVLVRTEGEAGHVTLLLDCGFSVPPMYWQQELDPEVLDGIWISHFHADHAFGLPALLVRLWEERRQKDLQILGQKGIESFVRSCLDLAYPNFYSRLKYVLRFIEVEPGDSVPALGLSWNTAANDHPQRDLALRLEAKGKSLFYSGDGRPTNETRGLARGVQLLVHEAYQLSQETLGHGTVASCLKMADTCGAHRLALVHIQRQVRKERLEEIREMAASLQNCHVLVPEPGDRFSI